MPVKDNNSVIREWIITEFKGQIGKDIPEVETFADVDVEALTRGDDAPFYATLKIAEIDRVSDNGLRYDDELVTTIERTIADKRITGGMGHIDPEKVDIEFPASEVFWIGTQRHGGALWAKGYLPPGAAREELRLRKSTNARIATSIWGRPERRVEHEDGSYKAVNFDLLRLDLAPPERASLGLEGDFAITRELTTTTEDPMKEKGVIIAELTTADVQALPKAVVEAIIAEYRASADSEKELTDLKAERDQLKDANGQLATVLTEMSNASFDEAVDGLIAEITNWQIEDEQKPLLASLRTQIKRAVLEKVGDDRKADKVAPILKDLWEAEFKPLAQALVSKLSGPSVVLTPKAAGNDWRDKIASADGVKELQEKWGVG